jgi:PAS domain S-box-containing protein
MTGSIPDLVCRPERLLALTLYGILDTAPEPFFDDIVLTAKHLCATPVALVSLVTHDRQWFKAREGVDLTETPIEQSVCAHAMEQGDMLIIPDLSQDDRTRQNTLVTQAPFIRFYAGAVLKAANGEPLGALCVIDTEPRPGGLTDAQKEGLAALGRQVVQVMEMRRILTMSSQALSEIDQATEQVLVVADRLREEQKRHLLAQEAGRIGTFEVDIASNLTSVTPEMCRMYGLAEQASYDASIFESLVVDRATGSNRRSRVEGSAELTTEYAIRRADNGAIRWIARRAEFLRDETGAPIKLVGTVQDITERRLAEARRQAIIELGDRTRGASTSGEITKVATALVGEALGVDRVGYGLLDAMAGSFTIPVDWTDGLASVAGVHRLEGYDPTIARLRAGEVLVEADVSATSPAVEQARYLAIGVGAQITVPQALRGGILGVFFVHNRSPRKWSQEEVNFVRAIADRADAALARVEAEEQQRLLNHELSHRLKNNLTVVQAIAAQTLKGEPQLVQAFNERLGALSTAHEILLRSQWSEASLHEVLESALLRHTSAHRFRLQGAPMDLGPRATVSVALLAHEMATNAIKYGALSDGDGVVTVDWRIEAGLDARFHMTWRESGGPLVSEPASRGFGSRLLRAGLMGGAQSQMHYEPEGFRASFSATLEDMVEKAS